MNTKELRIGSFYMVKFPNKKEWEKHRLDPFSICQAINNEIKIKPIPLTEDRLLEFGFKKGKIYWIDLQTHYLELIPSEDYLYPVYVQIPELSHEKHQCVYLNRLKHVHQLQNLFFAITGKELELLKK